MFQDFAHAKGIHAFKATKVLGHAKQKDIYAGICTLEEQIHNDMSDELAKLGRQSRDVANMLEHVSNILVACASGSFALSNFVLVLLIINIGTYLLALLVLCCARLRTGFVDLCTWLSPTLALKLSPSAVIS